MRVEKGEDSYYTDINPFRAIFRREKK